MRLSPSSLQSTRLSLCRDFGPLVFSSQEHRPPKVVEGRLASPPRPCFRNRSAASWFSSVAPSRSPSSSNVVAQVDRALTERTCTAHLSGQGYAFLIDLYGPLMITSIVQHISQCEE